MVSYTFFGSILEYFNFIQEFMFLLDKIKREYFLNARFNLMDRKKLN